MHLSPRLRQALAISGVLLCSVLLVGCQEQGGKRPTKAELEKFKGQPPTAEQLQQMQQAQRQAMERYKNSQPPPYLSDPRYQGKAPGAPQ